MNDDEFDLFRKEIGEVDPLKPSNRASVKAVKEVTPGLLERRGAAVEERVPDANFLSAEHIPQVNPYDPIGFRRDGVQHGVYRKLRLGGYDVEARLDLHQLTLEQARKEVFGFIRESYHYGLRTVMILHGKGARNQDRPALLKSATAHWLKQMDEVMAYHSAVKHHGGNGAVYVLLRKGERAKRENRERHGGRGV